MDLIKYKPHRIIWGVFHKAIQGRRSALCGHIAVKARVVVVISESWFWGSRASPPHHAFITSPESSYEEPPATATWGAIPGLLAETLELGRLGFIGRINSRRSSFSAVKWDSTVCYEA